ncbi:TonB-dependent receptor [Ralstonia pseudosolanacearum]|uniref:TonB-dependent receptor n=1 Tax=Ralstonia pseudosolanacearum TaxID=1310165 RepID=UPI0002C0F7AA|nr:TonB-dependent siderophore receptor [Ralstonia pseudosolanacearum]AGH86423.1 Ferrichrome-iron receptor [Ralstonia pseudosolanacearum FQY_4]ANH36275.1 Ferrichrome-iron receptor [Ralstonia solanacearum]
MLSSLRRKPASAMPLPARGSGAPFRPLALTARMAFAGVLTSGLGLPAFAQSVSKSATETAEQAIQLPETVATGRTSDDPLRPYAGGQTARGGRVGLLGNQDTLDTPFSVSTTTARRMEDQQATTLADVLNKDASVRFTGQTGGVTDSFYIRGFPVGEGNLSEVAFDGVYGVAPNYHVFPEYVERVEVIKGPAALLYGMSPNSGVGGVVNIVPKRALPQDLARFTATYASDLQLGGHIDLSRRFGQGRAFGIRFNGVARQGKTPLDHQRSRTDIGALSLDYQGDRLRASLDVITQHEAVDAPTRPFLLAAGVAMPSAADGRRNVSQPWGWWKSDGQSALAHAEYDVSDRVTVFADAGGSQTRIGRLSDQTPTLLDAAGNTRSTPGYYKFQVNRLSADAGVRARVDTGPVRHALALQASTYHDRIATASNMGTAILSNLYAPVSAPEPFIAAPAAVPKTSSSQLSGVALADTMGVLDDRLQLTLGLRQQQVNSDNFSASTGAVTASYDKRAVTPMAGIVIKPWRGDVSLYANYIEGLSKGDIAPTTASNAGQVFAPYKTRQYEAGVKVDRNGLLATLAVFQITKPSGQLTGTVYGVDGEQRNRGVELNLSGEPVRGVRLLGGVTVLDAVLTKTNSAATVGNRPVGVPGLMANAGAEWDLPWMPGLALNGSVTYTAKEYINQANTQSVPSWTTVDVGARYTTRLQGKSTTFRATVLNVLDRKYWSGVASFGTISLGAPRTALLSASVDF